MASEMPPKVFDTLVIRCRSLPPTRGRVGPSAGACTDTSPDTRKRRFHTDTCSDTFGAFMRRQRYALETGLLRGQGVGAPRISPLRYRLDTRL